MPPSWAGGTLGPGLVLRSAGSCLLSTVLKQLLVHLSRCFAGRSRRSPGEGEFAIRPGTGTSVRCLFAFKSPKSACLLMIEVFFFFFYLRGNLRELRPVPGVPVFRSFLAMFLGPLSPLASGTRWLLSSGQRTPSVLGKILESLRGRVPSASPASLWETPPGCFGIGPPGSSSPFVFNRLSLCPFALVSTLFSIGFIFRPLYAIRHLCARDFNPQGLVLLSPSTILLLLFF